MRIAVDLRSLMETGGKISGVENYVLNSVDRVALLNPDVFAFFNNYREVVLPPLQSKVKVIRTRIPNKILNSVLRFFKQPKFEKLYGDFDLLWMPDLRPFAIHRKTKLAISIHDLSPVMHPEHFSGKRRIWHHLISYQKSLLRADLLITISEYTKQDLIKIFNIPAGKIKVIYPGVDHNTFHSNLNSQALREVKKKYNLPEKFLLSISTIEPRKNILNLIKAFEKISDQATHLVLAGRLGWLYADILEYIKSSPKKDKIHMLGYVLEGDKPYLIANAKMVCYPSYYEGFGFVPLEAMACGVPVITSGRTAMAEVCAEAALLVEPYALTDLVYGIDQLLSDEKLRLSLIAKGLERVKKFNWQKSAEEINRSLCELLA